MDKTLIPVPGDADTNQLSGMSDGALLHCSGCGTSGYYPESLGGRCPVCGGVLRAVTGNDGEAADAIVEIRLPFAKIDCPSCAGTTVLHRDRLCSLCGAPLGAEVRDRTVAQRRRAFKAGIGRLLARAAAAGITDPPFARRGASMSVEDYLKTVLRPTVEELPATVKSVKEAAREARWDGDDPASLEAFQRILTTADGGIQTVSRLAKVLPPIQMRGVHHLLTRAAGELVAGHLALLSTVLAPDVDEAFVRQRDCQRLLDSAAAAAQRLARLIPRLDDLNAPGWWMSGSLFDHAAIAWTAMQGQPATIRDASEYVRSMLANVPGVADLDDASAILFLPATVLPTAAADTVVVRDRAILARSVIDHADKASPGWLADPDELVVRINRGVRGVSEQILRAGAAPLDPEQRRNNLHLMANVYASLVEGPLRDLGAVVVIAARAVRGAPNSIYVSGVAGGVQSGEVVQELDRLGGAWRQPASMLFRNAAAHAAVRVLDDGVEMRQVRTEDGVVVDETVEIVSDAEFAEEFARLQETMLAMQLTVLPWFLTHPDPRIAAARAAVVPTEEEACGILGLLSGLCGLVDVSVSRADAVVTIVARPAGATVDIRSPSIPSLLPAAFALWPDVGSIILRVATREEVIFCRAELPPAVVALEDETLAAVGLMNRRWQGELDSTDGIRQDLIFVVRPHLRALLAVLRHVIDQEMSVRGLAEAEQILQRLHSRLTETTLPAPRSPLIGEASRLLLQTVRRLRAMRTARVGGDMSTIRSEARRCAAITDQIVALEAKVASSLR